MKGKPVDGASDLRFGADGTFRILAISDTHYVATPDVEGRALIAKLIKVERPGLVVVNGDCLSGNGMATADEARAAVSHVARPMEEAGVPWAVTFGNHDMESLEKVGLSEEQVLAMFAAHPHNRNAGWAPGLSSPGNRHLLIADSAGSRPLFNVWLINSNWRPRLPEYRYDYVRADQVAWYWETSKALERRYGSQIMSLMFLHVPVPETKEMVTWVKIEGERHEPECPSNVNGGLFAAALDRGDVKGMFFGHDHVNNYVGVWRGIQLGYCGVAGFGCYPRFAAGDRVQNPADVRHNRVRGGRVFVLNESDPGSYRTYMRFKDGSTNWDSWLPGGEATDGQHR